MIVSQSLKEVNPTENDKIFNLTTAQDGFIFCEKRFPGYVAAWGTGKSFAGIQRAMMLSEESPNNLGIIFRKEFTDLRDSTLKDFELYTGMKVNSQRSVKLANGSEILFKHLEEVHGTMQNVNLGWFWIEQAEELESDTQFFVLHGRLRREAKRRSGFITANTNGRNWIYRLWKLGNLPDSALFEATSFDNAHILPPDTIKSWRDLEKTKPAIYRRFVMNSWSEADAVDVIIQPSWIEAAAKRELNIRKPLKRIVSVDVARFGDDKTVLYAIENNVVLGREEWEKKNTMETVGLAQTFAKRHNVDCFAVDEIGVGAGVSDRLRELGKTVIGVNSSERSDFPLQYYNRRAEIYGYGATLFEDGHVQIQHDDFELMDQLSWAKYRAIRSNGLYQVEAKDEIKKRFGKSPDFADAFLNGLWALKRAPIVVHSDRYQINRPRVQLSPLAL